MGAGGGWQSQEGKKRCAPQGCDGKWGPSASSARSAPLPGALPGAVRGALSPNVGKREGHGREMPAGEGT